MSSPYTRFTGQWADLPFEEVAKLASGWGFDGLEIAVSGDHLDACELGPSDSTPSLRGCGNPPLIGGHISPPTEETPVKYPAAASSSPRAVCGKRSGAGTALVRCRRSFRLSGLLRFRACCVPMRFACRQRLGLLVNDAPDLGKNVFRALCDGTRQDYPGRLQRFTKSATTSGVVKQARQADPQRRRGEPATLHQLLAPLACQVQAYLADTGQVGTSLDCASDALFQPWRLCCDGPAGTLSLWGLSAVRVGTMRRSALCCRP